MKLFYSPAACSLASHVAFEEAGLPYETTAVSIREGQHLQPEYLKVNPRAKVPALVLDDGRVLTENGAILNFLSELAPAARLLPPPGDPDRPFALSWLSYFASTVHVAFKGLFRPERLVDDPALSDAVRRKATETVRGLMQEIDDHLRGRSFLLGDRFVVADVYLVIFWNWCRLLGIDTSAWPNYRAAVARVAARPSVQRALAIEGMSVEV